MAQGALLSASMTLGTERLDPAARAFSCSYKTRLIPTFVNFPAILTPFCRISPRPGPVCLLEVIGLDRGLELVNRVTLGLLLPADH